MQLLNEFLPIAISDGGNLEARTQVALANTLSGFVESTSSCTSEHSIEHALSAHHPELAHGAGLIMLSKAYFAFFADKLPERFSEMAQAMGKDVNMVAASERPQLFIAALKEMQEAYGVATLKMSDYGITREEFGDLADNALQTMGALFALDRISLTREDVIGILDKSYR